MSFDWKFSPYTFRLLIERYEFHATVLPVKLVFLVMFLSSLLLFEKDYLFIYSERERGREAERQGGRDTGRGRSRLHAGRPTWDLILEIQDHTPGCRQC